MNLNHRTIVRVSRTKILSPKIQITQYPFNLKVFFQILFSFLLLGTTPLKSESYIGILGGRNGGEHIFETGNKYPNLSGIRGGSRITYDRNYNFGGVEGGYTKKQFSIEGKFATTGWNVRTGNSRDEDFFLGQVSTERGTKLSLAPLFLHDSAHTYTGTQNFGDGIGPSTVSEYRLQSFIKYYLNERSASPWETSNGFYFAGGIRYNYFKYYLYDVNQFFALRDGNFYGPIGNGLSYAHASLEYGGGAGGILGFGKLIVDSSLILLVGRSEFRDFHVQRALNFEGESYGLGFLAKLQMSYLLSTNSLLRISYEAHRQFNSGSFRTRGGLNANDVLSNALGEFKAYTSTKEAYIEVGGIFKL